MTTNWKLPNLLALEPKSKGLEITGEIFIKIFIKISTIENFLP